MYRRILAFSIVITLCAPLLAAGSMQEAGTIKAREEVVYANLDASGTLNEVYVVTTLDVVKAGTVVDYGSYLTVKNLTNTAPIALAGDRISVEAPVGRFFYQGTSKELKLPWEFSISYVLDGVNYNPRDLAGKSGLFNLKVSTSQGSIATPYFDNYVLQLSVTLDANKFSNITAPGATIANAGQKKMVTFTVLPGRTAELVISALVKDFSLPPIEISAVPLSIQFSWPDASAMVGQFAELSSGMSSLEQGLGQLKNGAEELSGGALALHNGSEQFKHGISSLSSVSPSLLSGSAEIRQALNTIAASLSSDSQFSLIAIAEVPAVLNRLGQGIAEISSGLNSLHAGFTSAHAALDMAIKAIPESTITSDDFRNLYLAAPAQKEVIDKLSEHYAAGQRVKATYQQVKPAFSAITETLTSMSAALDEIYQALSGISLQMEQDLISNTSAAGLAQLAQGMNAIAAEYANFDTMLGAYATGMTELTESYNQINTGIAALSAGSADLSQGLNQVYTGAQAFNEGVKELPQRVEAELVSQYDKSDFVPTSFVSAKNQNTCLVQFVMRTQPIEKKVESIAVPDRTPASFWERLIKLFKR